MELPESFRGAAFVAVGESVLLEEYRGVADGRAGTPIAAATRFQLSSVSKQFVAAAVLLLAEEGRLSIDDALAAWFRGCPASWSSITIADALSHTAGLGHWPDYGAIDPARPIDDESFIAALFERELPPLPAAHAYSSLGYGLLARVIERAGGLAYAEFVTSRILAPLEMRDSFVGNAGERASVARGHHDGVECAGWELDSTSKGAGDVWATVRDLDRWDRALSSGPFLQAESRAAMFAPRVPLIGLPGVTGYGFGWLVGELHGRPWYFHGGDNPGFACLNIVVPSEAVRVIVLTNEDLTDVYTPGMAFVDAALA